MTSLSKKTGWNRVEDGIVSAISDHIDYEHRMHTGPYKPLPDHVSALENDEEKKHEFFTFKNHLLAGDHDFLEKFLYPDLVQKLSVAPGKNIDMPADMEDVCDRVETYMPLFTQNIKERTAQVRRDIANMYITGSGEVEDVLIHALGETKNLNNMLADLWMRIQFADQCKRVMTDHSTGPFGKTFTDVHAYPLTIADRLQTGADIVLTYKDATGNKQTALIATNGTKPYAGAMYDRQSHAYQQHTLGHTTTKKRRKRLHEVSRAPRSFQATRFQTYTLSLPSMLADDDVLEQALCAAGIVPKSKKAKQDEKHDAAWQELQEKIRNSRGSGDTPLRKVS